MIVSKDKFPIVLPKKDQSSLPQIPSRGKTSRGLPNGRKSHFKNLSLGNAPETNEVPKEESSHKGIPQRKTLPQTSTMVMDRFGKKSKASSPDWSNFKPISLPTRQNGKLQANKFLPYQTFKLGTESIKVTRNLKKILQLVLANHPQITIVKDYYKATFAESYDDVFKNAFNEDSKTPLESAAGVSEKVPLLIISPREKLEFDPKNTGYNPELQIITNLKLISSQEKPYFKEFESPPKEPPNLQISPSKNFSYNFIQLIPVMNKSRPEISHFSVPKSKLTMARKQFSKSKNEILNNNLLNLSPIQKPCFPVLTGKKKQQFPRKKLPLLKENHRKNSSSCIITFENAKLDDPRLSKNKQIEDLYKSLQTTPRCTIQKTLK